jgi:hypothetical protein
MRGNCYKKCHMQFNAKVDPWYEKSVKQIYDGVEAEDIKEMFIFDSDKKNEEN